MTAYLIIIAVPASLLAAYGLFRWRYQRAVRDALYALGAPQADPPPDDGGTPRTSLTVTWTEGSPHEAPLSADLAEAFATSHKFQRAFLIAGFTFTATSALVVWLGWQPDRGGRTALTLAYFMTLPPLLATLAFRRPSVRGWLFAAGGWAVAGVVLLVAVGLPWRRLGEVFIAGLSFVSYALLAVALLVPRTTRVLVVGFVPLIGLWLALSVLFIWILGLTGFDLQPGLTAPVMTGGLVAGLLGIAAGVREVRQGVRWTRIATLVAFLIASGVAGYVRPTLIAALTFGVAFNALFVLVVWYGFRWFLHLKATGLLPDEVLHFILCAVGQTALLPAYVNGPTAPLWLLPIATSTWVLFALLSRASRAVPRRTPQRLVLLRAFSRGSIRSRLLNALDDSWRRIGTVELIVGVDLAVRTLSVAALENFLLGRIDRQFVRTRAEGDERVASLRTGLALDGRYPVNELHCLPSVWTHVVNALVRGADVVLMDLRGFQSTNRGLLYELALVMSRVPLHRIVLVTDGSTDERALTGALQRFWSRVPIDSPNAALSEATVEIVRCSGVQSADCRTVVNRVFSRAFVALEALHAENA